MRPGDRHIEDLAGLSKLRLILGGDCPRRRLWGRYRLGGATEKFPYSENFRVSSWSYDMESHAKKCVERCCESSDKTMFVRDMDLAAHNALDNRRLEVVADGF